VSTSSISVSTSFPSRPNSNLVSAMTMPRFSASSRARLKSSSDLSRICAAISGPTILLRKGA
jgi:hypothetical protein